MLMVYMGVGVMTEMESLADLRTLLVDGHGWTMLTAVNLMLFSLPHNPCATTIITIYKETVSARWTALGALMPLAIAFLVTFLTATTALRQMDAEFENVSASLAVPFYRTFWRVTVPMALPSIVGISMYFFLNAMVTLSAVVFLVAPGTELAAVAVLLMDDAGDTAQAAAMSVCIIAIGLAVRLGYWLLLRNVSRRTEAWRDPSNKREATS